jgi:ketosteroid isomerase-like protein
MAASRRQLGRAAGALGLLAAAPLAAQTAGGDGAAIAAAVEELHAAIIAADAARLGALVSDRLTYGHSAGRIENKAQFIDQLVSRRSVFRSINVSDQVITLSGDVATVRHVLTGETESNGRPAPVRISVLHVWQKEPDRWRLLARQAVALPG